MKEFLDRANRFIDLHTRATPRLLLVVAALALLPTYFLPLYRMTMFAPQYPDGLRLDIYSYTLRGGNDGQDIKEINVLNHYIGMRDLVREDFTEFKWMPFVIGVIGLLFLRAAVHGHMANLIDAVVLYFYFGAFSMWSFGYKMWSYGHNLSPTAAVKVDPFLPPLFGYKQLANFEVYSYPAAGTYAFVVVGMLLVAAVWLGWRQGRALLASAM